MNQEIFILINNWAGHITWLDALMAWCAQYLMYLMVVAVVAYGAVNFKRWRDMAVVSIVSALVARIIVAEPFKLLYKHPRPYWVLSQVNLLLAKETESSFPSGHTIFVFALATGVYLYNKKAGWWFFAGAALVGFARIFTGVHWPYDIIAGAILGIATAYVCNRIYLKFFLK